MLTIYIHIYGKSINYPIKLNAIHLGNLYYDNGN